ncbi:TonB-dependent receptor [Qipengyuania sp. DY56-A-20]|jgi:iron complex outermembrane recepter protein|uniref:TonB-dependent receptor n=1 Tax=Qipengyuania benthica TaxID=3067651 RepID=A0ABT9HBQ9_9SPHN|nr:TonB-dependent receptor [Qipengyuania sp. DY56-A-20]MDP4540750.1 TonB-dependent receptor [Qipengyuania sp. DY56-A-20]
MKTRYASLRVLALLGAGAALAPAAAMAQDQTDTDLIENADVVDDNVIVVTAQGRAQVLADVPVAINAVSAEQLERSGTNDIRELTQVAPSLLVSSTGNEANGSARIRGIGTVGDNAGLESSVAVFVDGVYRSRSGNALSELGPLDRIEILRGPQGTLGGRNSSAGLISIYTAQPEFTFGGHGSISYGNYDAIRVEGGLTGPLSDTIAARVDGVYSRRDGFYNDVVNDTDVNNRDRYLVRAQLLFEPTEDISFRLVGDYSKKDEACCAATFVQTDFAPLARLSDDISPLSAEAKFDYPGSATPALTSTANPIIPVLLGLGQNPIALNGGTFNRDIYVTPGRTYQGETEDFGVSGELNWSFGDTTLTSITGYREYSNFQASDTDYTQVDILYRAPTEDAGAREFKTFTQELRLSGSAFDDRLEWLVGGFYANEKLESRDNLRFGTQYGTFANCRLANALQPTLGALIGQTVADPSRANCFNPTAFGAIQSGAVFGAATPAIVAGLTNLATLNDRGGTGDVYNQQSESFAVFTHNIFHITDNLDLTLGLRYTNETKDFDATFGNDNTVCPTNRAILGPLLGVPSLAAFAGGILGLSCQGNSTAELDGVSLSDSRDENEFTGTAVLSYKPTDDLMVYASYSRGYKAGGFNLDRSALAEPVFLNVNNIDISRLQFDQETVDAFELGAKYSTREFGLSVAAFRQEFTNFQLNTFNGTVYLVQNVNGCSDDLGGADRDGSVATGACAADNVIPGVVAQGVEIEGTLNPSPDFNVTLGLTYADTSFENDLIGNDSGAPLDPALRLLPGDNMSNAPEITVTSSVSWTPPIGNSGMRGLVFFNTRLVSDYNTGSDLLYGKEQDSFMIANGRIGLTNIAGRFAIEGWVQNIFDKDYTQVAFNTPFVAEQQTYSAFLAEPRTYGITLRGEF